MIQRAKHLSKALGPVRSRVSYSTVKLGNTHLFCLLNKTTVNQA